MSKTPKPFKRLMIVYGVPEGADREDMRLRSRMSTVIDPWAPGSSLVPNALHVAVTKPQIELPEGGRIVSFERLSQMPKKEGWK